ncbi:hypothetical protein [Cellulomonas sp.]|uniref:HNH endonuclease signature motif containing protein n=1 Tax=Cellulomonas sp. TaxID=40001 RepID=UPI003BACA14F
MFEAAPADAEGGWRAGSRGGARQPDGQGSDTRVVAAAVADLLAAARRLAGLVDDGGAQDAAGRRVVLSGLRPVDGVLAGVRSAVLLAERDSTSWQRPGVPSFEAAHGAVTRTGLPGARREIAQADVLASMPAVAGAVQSGAMPVGHLDAFARITTGASQTVSAALATPGVQDAIVRLGSTQDAPTFTRSVQRLVAELDPAARDRAHENQRARRFLHLSDQSDGTHIRGLLDRVAGHRLRLALEATGERPSTTTGAPDNAGDASNGSDGSDGSDGTVLEERTAEQARADALDTISQRILALPSTASGAAVPPQISLLMTEETFAALRTHATRSHRPARTPTGQPAPNPVPGTSTAVTTTAGAAHDGPADPAATARTMPNRTADPASALTGVPAVTLEDGTPIPTSEVAKILCDCEITRIVMNAADQPVNLGRSVRLYTGAHRRAIIARDRHCTFPGCDRHARWSQIHHITWWDRDNGSTSIDNGVLLCSFHHHQVHQHNLTIQRHPTTRGPRRPDQPTLEPPGTRYTFHDPTGRIVASTDHHPPPPLAHHRE